MWSEMRITTLMSCSIKQKRDAFLLADREQKLVQPLALARIEARGGLVEAEQQRPRAHRARDLEPALVAIGQLARRSSARRVQPDPVKPMAREFDCLLLCLAEAADAENGADGEPRRAHQHVVLRHHQVLEHRHAVEQPDVLEGAGDAGSAIDLVVVKPFEIEAPAVRLGELHHALRSACRTR